MKKIKKKQNKSIKKSKKKSQLKSKRSKKISKVKKIKSKINKKNKVKAKKKNISKVKEKTKKKILNKPKEKSFLLKIINFQNSLKPEFKFRINFNIEKYIQAFFDKISETISNYKTLKKDEQRRIKLEKQEQERQEKRKRKKKTWLEPCQHQSQIWSPGSQLLHSMHTPKKSIFFECFSTLYRAQNPLKISKQSMVLFAKPTKKHVSCLEFSKMIPKLKHLS